MIIGGEKRSAFNYRRITFHLCTSQSSSLRNRRLFLRAIAPVSCSNNEKKNSDALHTHTQTHRRACRMLSHFFCVPFFHTCLCLRLRVTIWYAIIDDTRWLSISIDLCGCCGAAAHLLHTAESERQTNTQPRKRHEVAPWDQIHICLWRFHLLFGCSSNGWIALRADVDIVCILLRWCDRFECTGAYVSPAHTQPFERKESFLQRQIL